MITDKKPYNNCQTLSYLQSQRIVKQIIQHIDNQVWQKIAINTLTKITPFYIQLQTNHTLNSFGMMSQSKGNLGKKKYTNFPSQLDPQPAHSDKLKQGFIKIQQKSSLIKSNSEFSHDLLNNNSKLFNKKSEQKSKVLSSRVRSITQKSITSNSKKQILSKFQPLITQAQINPIQGQRYKLWKKYVDQQQDKRKKNQQNKQKNKILQQTRIKNLKNFKQLKNVTYDYEGNFFGVNQKKISSNNNTFINVKSTFSTKSVDKKNNHIQTQSSPFTNRNIENSRLKEIQNKMNMQKNVYEESISMYRKLKTCTGILNTLANQEDIADGVTIKQNSKILSKPWKGGYSQISRKMKLTQFKNTTRNKNFREYSSSIRHKNFQTLKNSDRIQTQSNILTSLYKQQSIQGINKISYKNNYENLRITSNFKLKSQDQLKIIQKDNKSIKSFINMKNQKLNSQSLLQSSLNTPNRQRKVNFKNNSNQSSRFVISKKFKGFGNINIINNNLYTQIVDQTELMY